MCSDFVDAVRKTFADGGYRKTENGVETGGTFLVGHAGRIFEIEGDFQVGEPAVPYASVGCGFELALGSLHTSLGTSGLTPHDRALRALEAAQAFSAGVRAPFHVEAL